MVAGACRSSDARRLGPCHSSARCGRGRRSQASLPGCFRSSNTNCEPRGREGCLWLPDVSRLRTGNLDRGRCDHFAGLILAAAFTEYCAFRSSIRDFKRVTAAADIYSFGCILHDLFDGARRVPYQRQSCPGPVGAVIEKCTDPDPNKRFKSIDELRGALFWALSQPRARRPALRPKNGSRRWHRPQPGRNHNFTSLSDSSNDRRTSMTSGRYSPPWIPTNSSSCSIETRTHLRRLPHRTASGQARRVPMGVLRRSRQHSRRFLNMGHWIQNRLPPWPPASLGRRH